MHSNYILWDINVNSEMNLKLSVSPEEKMSDDVHSMFLLFRPKVVNAIKKIRESKRRLNNDSILFFFCVGFFSQTFTNHRTAGEGGGHFFNSSLPLPPAS